MRQTLFVTAALVLPLSAMAAHMDTSAFTGTWKTTSSSVKPSDKLDVYLLKDGVFTCKTCVPVFTVKADGAFHPVTGIPYIDMASIKVVDAHSIVETDKKNGKVVATSTVTVSPDGKDGTVVFSDSSNTNGAPVTGKTMFALVTAGPAGSHAVSGSWRTVKTADVSDNGMTVMLKADGDMLSFSNPTGQSYDAKLDGTETPEHGDAGVSTVSVKKVNATTIMETDKRDGKVVGTVKMVISKDGKTMKVAYTDTLRNATETYVATKQ